MISEEPGIFQWCTHASDKLMVDLGILRCLTQDNNQDRALELMCRLSNSITLFTPLPQEITGRADMTFLEFAIERNYQVLVCKGLMDERCFCPLPDATVALYRTLSRRSPSGRTYGDDLKTWAIDSSLKERITLWMLSGWLDCYLDRTSNPERRHTALAVKECLTVYQYDESSKIALQSLLLLVQRSIDAHYLVLSPERGRFFGSRLFSFTKQALMDLGIDAATQRSMAENLDKLRDQVQRYIELQRKHRYLFGNYPGILRHVG